MIQTPASQYTRTPEQLLVVASLSLATLGMAAQLFIKIHRYAVNILFSDQWITYKPLFYDYGIWQSFTQQWGPPRLGLGVFVSKAVAIATGWNIRAEAFVIGFILLLIAVMAVYLKWRLFKKLTIWDSLIPLICLSPPQIEGHVAVPFPSYSAVPNLLLMLYAICLTCHNVKLRYGMLSLLNFLLVFTGWGVFVGALTPVLLGYSVFRHTTMRADQAKRWASLAFGSSLLSLGLFAVNYEFEPAAECFHFPHYPLTDYLWFSAHIFSSSAGLACRYFRLTEVFGIWVMSTFVEVFGIWVVSTFVTVLICAVWKLSREREYRVTNLVIALFISFSLAFALSTVVGRVCFGVCAAHASRYQTLLVPAWLGFYFTVVTLKDRFYRAGAASLILMICFLLPQSKNFYDESGLRYYYEVKTKWKACYVEKEDAETCDKKVGMSIYHPFPSIKAQDRLDYLKQRQLNFFADN